MAKRKCTSEHTISKKLKTTQFKHKEKKFRRDTKPLLEEILSLFNYYRFQFHVDEKDDTWNLLVGTRKGCPVSLSASLKKKLFQLFFSTITKECVDEILRIHGGCLLDQRIETKPIFPAFNLQTWKSYLGFDVGYEHIYAEIVSSLLPFWDLVDLVDECFVYLALLVDTWFPENSTESVWEKIKFAQKTTQKENRMFDRSYVYWHRLNILLRIGKTRTLKKFSPEYLHHPDGWVMQKFVAEKL